MTMKDLAQESGLSYDSVRRKVGSESREITISELSAMTASLKTPITEFLLCEPTLSRLGELTGHLCLTTVKPR